MVPYKDTRESLLKRFMIITTEIALDSYFQMQLIAPSHLERSYSVTCLLSLTIKFYAPIRSQIFENLNLSYFVQVFSRLESFTPYKPQNPQSSKSTGKTGPLHNHSIIFPYYGIGQNYGNWIFQPFSTIFPKYFHTMEMVQFFQ